MPSAAGRVFKKELHMVELTLAEPRSTEELTLLLLFSHGKNDCRFLSSLSLPTWTFLNIHGFCILSKHKDQIVPWIWLPS